MRLEEEIKQAKFKNPYHKLVINLLYTGNWMETWNKKFLKPFDISPEQFNVLRILRGHKGAPATVASLNERMLDKMSNVSRLVEKLRKKGLVERKECPEDRRQVDIYITKAGLELLEKIDNAMPDLFSKVNHLTRDEAEMLNHLLDKCRSGAKDII